MTPRWAMAMIAGLLCGAASPADGQSLTGSTVRGSVRDSAGAAVFGAEVSVMDQSGGIPRHAVTSRDGSFRVAGLPPGSYDVLVENIGYRPKRVRSVPMGPGADVTLRVELVAAPPPVDRVDTVTYAGSAAGGRGSGMSARLSSVAAAEFADWYQDARDLLRHASEVTDRSARGAPADRQLLVIDGVAFAPARHPGLPGAMDLLTIPVAALERSEVAATPADVEWPGQADGLVTADTRRGSNAMAVQVSGDFRGAFLGASRFFDPKAVAHSSFRGTGVVSGPIIRDTAVFVAGVAVRREETPLPPIAFADPPIASVLSVANDSFGQDLSAYSLPRLSRATVVSGFGRLDWALTGTSALAVRFMAGTVMAESPFLGLALAPSPGSRLKGADITGSVSLTSSFGGRFSQEFRAGVSRSRREWTGGTLRPTTIADPAVSFGDDPALPGTFARTDLSISDAVHVDAGAHDLKLSLEGMFTSFDNTYAANRAGSFEFGDATRFARREGSFSQATGPAPLAKFTLPGAALGVQDAWSPGSGLRLTYGLRAEYHRLPTAEILRHDSLTILTGLINTGHRPSLVTVSPRLGFSWDLGERGSLIVRGGAGVYAGRADPGLLTELITHSGRARAKRGLGVLADWPTIPDSAQAPPRGPDLSLADSVLTAPRTRAVTLGLSQALGSSSALHVTGTYRHQDFLPRRHDLNLLQAPTTTDARGRPVYGTLQQLGGQLAAVPGSNRRFTAFSHIWALDPDGFSDHWGLTVALERETRSGVRLLWSYTYSQTTDNWHSALGGTAESQLAPFPRGGVPGLVDEDWSRGPADLDTPHHVSLGAVLPVSPVRWGVRLGLLYSYRSGQVFTPGFRDGVDANGDGSYNDPAFVDESIAGTTDLYPSWNCLQGQAGLIAGRNSCRAPGVQTLDLRLSVSPVRTPAIRAELVLDAINLLDAAEAPVDRALYLVDASRSLSANPATGVLTVPLLVNPSFGQPRMRLTSGRSYRIGLRIIH